MRIGKYQISELVELEIFENQLKLHIETGEKENRVYIVGINDEKPTQKHALLFFAAVIDALTRSLIHYKFK